jgi:tetratricopeptide (TPR) repeat protein
MKTTFSTPVRGGPPVSPWIVRHGQQVLLALAAAVAAVLIATFVVTRLQEAGQRAWEQLSYAESLAAQGRVPDAAKTIDSLLASRRTGPETVQALLLKSDLRLREGKKDEALAAAREALRQAVSTEYKSLASLSVARALEENGRPAEAGDAYGKFIKDFPDHFLVPRAYAQRARLMVSLGRLPEARVDFEKLITLYPSTLWAADAKKSLEDLKVSISPAK